MCLSQASERLVSWAESGSPTANSSAVAQQGLFTNPILRRLPGVATHAAVPRLGPLQRPQRAPMPRAIPVARITITTRRVTWTKLIVPKLRA